MRSLKRLARALFGAVFIALAAGSPASAEWLKAETTHFIIYGDTSERSIRAYAEKVERFDNLLRAYYPIQVDHEIPKLEIYLADGLTDLRKASPGISASVGGYYSPNSARIHAVANTASQMADDIIFHEYGHHFMYQMKSAAYPSWFVEGFAEYYATVQFQGDRIQIGRHNPGRMNSLTQAANRWAPMEDVLRWRVSSRGRYRGADYYAQSWALTHYFLSDPERTRALSRYLDAVAGGTDPVEALRGTLGRTPQQLHDDVRRYLLGPINYFTPQIDLPTPEVVVSRMTPEEGRLAWLDLRLDTMRVEQDEISGERRDGEGEDVFRRRIDEARQEYAEERANLIRDALSGAGTNPTAANSLLVKARAERLALEPMKAVQTLEPLTSGDQADARALRVAAEALLDQAGKEEDPTAAAPLVARARGYLGRALDANPLDFRTYLALDTTRRSASGYPSPNDLSTLEIANQLAPQSFDTRMRYAQALMSRDRSHEAIGILSPVAHSPHGGPLRRQARLMLATAQANAGAAVQPVDEIAPGDGAHETDGDEASAEGPTPGR